MQEEQGQALTKEKCSNVMIFIDKIILRQDDNHCMSDDDDSELNIASDGELASSLNTGFAVSCLILWCSKRVSSSL